MSLVIAWLLFPAVLGLICAGHGLLVDRLAGGRLPGVLVVPVGLAALIVVSQLTTYRGATAPPSTTSRQRPSATATLTAISG